MQHSESPVLTDHHPEEQESGVPPSPTTSEAQDGCEAQPQDTEQSKKFSKGHHQLSSRRGVSNSKEESDRWAAVYNSSTAGLLTIEPSECIPPAHYYMYNVIVLYSQVWNEKEKCNDFNYCVTVRSTCSR